MSQTWKISQSSTKFNFEIFGSNKRILQNYVPKFRKGSFLSFSRTTIFRKCRDIPLYPSWPQMTLFDLQPRILIIVIWHIPGNKGFFKILFLNLERRYWELLRDGYFQKMRKYPDKNLICWKNPQPFDQKCQVPKILNLRDKNPKIWEEYFLFRIF